MDETGRTITASDFGKTRQKALAEELIKPKYLAYGFRTADLFKNLSEHFRNPAQIRYEMNKMKARDVISKPNNKSVGLRKPAHGGEQIMEIQIRDGSAIIPEAFSFLPPPGIPTGGSGCSLRASGRRAGA